MKSEHLYQSAQQHLIGGAGAGVRYHPLLKRPLHLACAALHLGPF